MSATEADIELSGEIVTAKVIVNTVKYYYDTEGKMTKKVITFSDNSTHTVHYENSDDNTVVKFTAGGQTVTSHSKTDSFGRKVFDELQLGSGFLSREFDYHKGEVTDEHAENGKLKSSPTTQLVSRILLSDGRTLSYEYDAEERITKVVDSVNGTTEYTYDALGQLLTERHNGYMVNSMTYDTYGNILSKNGKAYTYGDAKWKDLLTAVDGEAIEYDAQGNPIKYLGHTLTWEKGRQLKSFDGNTYTYNANGIRTSKTINGVKHEYTLDGTKILRETWGSNTLIPLYDNEDGVCGIIYNNIPYYFIKNLQGDIIAIANKNGKTVAEYSYDAWGVPTILSDSTGVIANVNPYRYRSYYYDAEIAKYYLQSRYYDAVVGRFVNGDEALYTQISEISIEFSIFTYCYNNAVNLQDDFGNLPNIIQRYLNAVKGYISAQAFKLVSCARWLGVCGTAARIAMTIKAISNYKKHVKKENQLPLNKEGYIDDQHDIKDWHLGYQNLATCGCEVISVYNAMKVCGIPLKLCELILYFELCGYVMMFGCLGSNPTRLWHAFVGLRLKYQSTFTLSVAEERIKKSSCGIVSCWNDPITTGLHTFMVKYDKKTCEFTAYNGYKGKENPSKALSNLVNSSKFIIGYSIK